MDSVAHPPPEQGQLVSARFRLWLVSGVRPSTLLASALTPPFCAPQRLLIFSWVDGLPDNLDACLDSVPEMSVIRSLFEADDEQDAASRVDLSWWESKGRRLEGRAVIVEARSIFDRVIALVQPVEPVRPRPQRPEAKGLFGIKGSRATA